MNTHACKAYTHRENTHVQYRHWAHTNVESTNMQIIPRCISHTNKEGASLHALKYGFNNLRFSSHWIQSPWILQSHGHQPLDSTMVGFNNCECNNPVIQQYWIKQSLDSMILNSTLQHLTRETWHMTPDMWLETCETWLDVNILWNLSCPDLMVWDGQGLEQKDDSINQSSNELQRCL